MKVETRHTTIPKNFNVHTSHHHIAEVLPQSTYLLFQGKYFEQVHGAGSGFQISPIVANLFMEEFKIKAINTDTNPPWLWLKYMDHNFAILTAEHSHQFLNTSTPLTLTYNSLQTPNSDGSICFLDTLFSPGPDYTLLKTVYRKYTHTDQYLQWHFHHNLSAKFSVLNTLTHKA